MGCRPVRISVAEGATREGAKMSDAGGIRVRAMRIAGGFCIALILFTTPQSAQANIKAGAARTVITPAIPFPLAGYSERYGRLSNEVNDDPTATAIVFKKDDTLIAMVSADLCGISAELRDAVCERLTQRDCPISPANVLLAATHTHNGPGGYVDHPVWMRAVGKYEQRIFDHLADRIAESITSAYAAMKPASIGWTSQNVPGFQQNRRGDETLDEMMTVVRIADSEGKSIAAMVQFSGHPTVLSGRDFQASRDWPGTLADTVREALGDGAECLFFNGAAGDLRVDLPPDQSQPVETRYERAALVGKSLGAVAIELLKGAELKSEVELRLTSRPCPMPPSTNAKLFPQRPSIVQRIEVGGLWLLTIPGEASAEIGLAMKRAAGRAGAKHAAIIGLANDHLGYLVTPVQHRAGGYEAMMCFYGPDTADDLARAALGDVAPELESMDSDAFLNSGLESDVPSPGADAERVAGTTSTTAPATSQATAHDRPTATAPAATSQLAAKKFTFKQIGDVKLELLVHTPAGIAPKDGFPAVVFFFGGGWANGDIEQFTPQAEHFSERGMVAIRADYRVRSRYKVSPFECMADGRSALRWVRAHAKELSIDPNRIAAAGGSAGGHVAASTAVFSAQRDATDDRVSARPDALVLFNPVVDTTATGYGAERLKDRAADASPLHNLAAGMPPTIIFHGSVDTTTPLSNVQAFQKRMKELGDRCELVVFDGRRHGFFNANRDREDYLAVLEGTDRFFVSLVWIESGF